MNNHRFLENLEIISMLHGIWGTMPLIYQGFWVFCFVFVLNWKHKWFGFYSLRYHDND